MKKRNTSIKGLYRLSDFNFSSKTSMQLKTRTASTHALIRDIPRACGKSVKPLIPNSPPTAKGRVRENIDKEIELYFLTFGTIKKTT